MPRTSGGMDLVAAAPAEITRNSDNIKGFEKAADPKPDREPK